MQRPSPPSQIIWSPRVAEPLPLDSRWLADHPLPALPQDTDKNRRGRVLAIGGCRFVAGGLRLTGEAALRAGAGSSGMAVRARRSSASISPVSVRLRSSSRVGPR